MTTKISPREWEAISAYLDGQLAPKDRTRLEARLERDTDLRAAMEDLRKVRMVLRSQPKMRAPRNFTLTPQMVGKRPVPRAYPAFRLVAAMASVLLVLVLIGDLFTGAPPVSTALNYPLDQRQSESAAPQPAAPAEMAAEAESEEANEKGLRALDMVNETATAEAQPEVAAMAEAAEEPAEEPPPMAAAPAMAPTETARATPAVEEFLAQEQDPSMDTQPAEGSPLEESGELAPTPSPARQPLWSFDRSLLRTIEIVLVLLALGSGLVAFYLRRASSG